MIILSIDPSSNIMEKSTTGIVLLDNTKLIDSFVVPYGATNFIKWWKETGKHLKFDIAVVEKFIVRYGDSGRDNTVVQTVDAIKQCIPSVVEQSNVGYQSDIPDSILKKCNLWKFQKTHHQDLRAASRLALFYAMRQDIREVVDEIGDRIYE